MVPDFRRSILGNEECDDYDDKAVDRKPAHTSPRGVDRLNKRRRKSCRVAYIRCIGVLDSASAFCLCGYKLHI